MAASARSGARAASSARALSSSATSDSRMSGVARGALTGAAGTSRVRGDGCVTRGGAMMGAGAEDMGAGAIALAVSCGDSIAVRFFGDSELGVTLRAWKTGMWAFTLGAPIASALLMAPTAVHFTTESATADNPAFDDT